MEIEREWAQLPKDLIERISAHLTTAVETLRFRSVCSSWRRSSVCGNLLPFPTIPSDGLLNKNPSSACQAFTLSKRTFLLIQGTQHQNSPWLVKVEHSSSDNTKRILNPLSRYGFRPDLGFDLVLDLVDTRVIGLGNEYVLKCVSSDGVLGSDSTHTDKVVVLWLNNSDNDFALFTVHPSGKLALFRSGGERWSVFKDMEELFDDVIAYKGSFYAVDHTGMMFAVALDGELHVVGNPIGGGQKKYLVECEGELLMVDLFFSLDADEVTVVRRRRRRRRQAESYTAKSGRYRVFKFNWARMRWVHVKCLGDQVLFLGEESAFAASGSAVFGGKGNCIFFEDGFLSACEQEGVDPTWGPEVDVIREIGAFELESGRLGSLMKFPEYSKVFWPPPEWITSALLQQQAQNQLEELSL